MALGLFKEGSAQKWGRHVAVKQGQHVSNLAQADFTEGSELMESLYLAVESLCKIIRLREYSVDE